VKKAIVGILLFDACVLGLMWHFRWDLLLALARHLG
jgi:hypothetical protein